MSDIYTCLIDTPLGKMRAAGREDAITGLWFEEQKYYPNISEWTEAKEHYLFKSLSVWIDEYFAGEKEACDLPLFLSGTSFQMEVWGILRQIKYGQSMTYGNIAKELSKKFGLSKMSAQAVGGAVGHNPISILIPCHRVLGSSGTLVGYAGGIDKKRFLLELEGVNL
ncbi:MAG: methylated-DNA--[protein]-cysteine S-methyltransferase [Campylobacteraceae bacterium]|jgi:methylated-DNA-[protein]-cysteine S-methyltransferase|nr:methylated-DNA--[protein]-cysteine S-methyltransferase [Campylobacteraceae bacterium]